MRASMNIPGPLPRPSDVHPIAHPGARPRIENESDGGPFALPRLDVERPADFLRPPSHRLDLDVSREFKIRSATFAPYLSVVNAYNAKNVFVYLYEYSTDRPNRRAISQFPVLPSVGVRVAF